jgi:CheY-like chemotaxis protein
MKVFISSTYQDLIEYRRKTAEAIERLGQQGIRMEVFGARPEGAIDVCRDEIAESDIFVGIYAHRYGYIPPNSELSITELEYDYASDISTPIFCFMIDETFPWIPAFIESGISRDKLLSFKEKIKRSLVLDVYSTPEDLSVKVATSIGRYIITSSVKEGLKKISSSNPAAVGAERDVDQVARRAERLSVILDGGRVLVVNDVPSDMHQVVRILESLNISVTIVATTSRAISLLSIEPYDLVISDMRRNNVPHEGLNLLQVMREKNLLRPTIFTVGRYEPWRGTPAYAFGITNRVDELLNLVFDILERVRG